MYKWLENYWFEFQKKIILYDFCRQSVSLVHLQGKKEWNGIIKTILDGEADMAMASLTITPERSEMIDFSVPFLETGIAIIVPVRDGVISPTAFLGMFQSILPWCEQVKLSCCCERALQRLAIRRCTHQTHFIRARVYWLFPYISHTP